MHTLIRELLVADVLAELGGRQAARPDPSAWARLLDSDLPNQASADGAATLKATIEERMVAPLTALSNADPLGRSGGGFRASGGASLPCALEPLEAAASYSAVLFGPPGTAKTTVVAAIASRLGWGFVTVDTSAFLRDGLGNVASRITHVFDRLLALDRVVVLFDEIEEFALDRSNEKLTMESRLLTTAMLTKLADLRGARKVAFFIATNRLAALDAAVIRPGRFDLQLFVGTPNLTARMQRFGAKLSALAVPADGLPVRAATAAFESVLERRWSTDAMFLTFLETERLAADSAALAATHASAAAQQGAQAELQAELETAFEALLDAQAATMTVRGTVRDDFLASCALSRV